MVLGSGSGLGDQHGRDVGALVGNSLESFWRCQVDVESGAVFLHAHSPRRDSGERCLERMGWRDPCCSSPDLSLLSTCTSFFFAPPSFPRAAVMMTVMRTNGRLELRSTPGR